MIISVRRATFKRWLKLSAAKYSILRSLEYEAIGGLKLDGKTLDLGGGKKNSYYDLLKINGIIESINISPDTQPTVLADINERLPFSDFLFDNVICLNTFEHILNEETAISEALRVLKIGGTFHFLIPFLYRVHGSPADFHRHTSEWWVWKLKKSGIDVKNIEIEPLIWSPSASAYSLVEGIYPKMFKKLVMLTAVIRHLKWKGMSRLPDQASDNYSKLALGYYIKGVK